MADRVGRGCSLRDVRPTELKRDDDRASRFKPLVNAQTREKLTPAPIRRAEWQAGVTPNSSRFRVLLDGEPMPLAFAASASEGWVICYREPELKTLAAASVRAPLAVEYVIGGTVRLNGMVQLIRCNE